MRINEVETQNANPEKLLALSQFLLDRAKDESAVKKISTDAFLNIAQGMKINLTADQLTRLAQQEPLNNVIASINNGEIIFKGGEVPADDMSVDKARDTVNKMAKRAASKGL